MKNKILILLLSMWCCAGYAQQTPQEEFLAILKSKSTPVQTISCNFTQVKHNTMLAHDAQSSGKFHFKRPGQLALIYDKPAGDRIVMGESDFLIVAGGSRSLVKIASNPLLQQLQRVFAACFSGDIPALCSDGVFRCEKGPKTYTVRITPESKRAKRYISEIVLVFSVQDMLLDELCMVERSGNYTRYQFQNKLTNKALAADYFDCNQ